jgi:hypothetical protein
MMPGDRVRIIPETTDQGPFGEFAEYIVVELPEYGIFEGYEAGGQVSVTPDGFTHTVYLDDDEIVQGEER